MKLNVPEMSCRHCTAAIEKAIKALDAGAQVDCDLAARSVSVKTTLEESAVRAAISEAGYETSAVA
ncbi:heavy-metal-associated domain-containing protein [Actibacterium sp. MT2.3-13A]|uniref:heavy-metal-associated domain-containing protein n=1 Tax=Actibacterium sp. MT2.3-13A TaxID=2828332 RepID=UPI001BAE23AB|nr:heavy-metal-associated domain-containing protein [Actibacterium sp. MT2.3-13A]